MPLGKSPTGFSPNANLGGIQNCLVSPSFISWTPSAKPGIVISLTLKFDGAPAVVDMNMSPSACQPEYVTVISDSRPGLFPAEPAVMTL
eukprot:CAMPEP_0172935878 /NCGR_PEP_ID=MMETSP1075-20121228/221738_1 /TAXON_ID=2916 /ORGANISM="Ceratium fusus, Strain PA161109" /LENGTH=88 /DNA_ID=CAMNT_0013797241 /DNA_START=123 /DNA_END=389 /DNA_ORIENTATION=-